MKLKFILLLCAILLCTKLTWGQSGDSIVYKQGDFGENNTLHYKYSAQGTNPGGWSSLEISGTGALNRNNMPPVHLVGQTNISVDGMISIGDSLFAGLGGGSMDPSGFWLFSLGIRNVTNIGNYAFANCLPYQGLSILSNNLISIGDGAFMGCMTLTNIPIPSKSIGCGAFSGGAGANSPYNNPNAPTPMSVTIPSSVESICGNPWGNSGFLLTSINVASDNANYSSEDGILYNKDKTVLIAGPCGKKNADSIPNSVTSISGGAFFGGALATITIPNSVSTIGDNAFALSPLTDVTVEWAKPLSVSNTVFMMVNTSSATLHVPYGTKALYQADSVWGKFGTIIEQAPPPNLSLSANSLNYIAAGEQKSFTITSNTNWTVSSNASWLTVSPASGNNNSTITVTAAANTATTQRTATITVSGTGVTAQTISVTQAAAVAVTGVKLNTASATILVGDTLRLTATVEPANATNKSLRWSSSAETVATVSSTGLVTGKAAGTALIIATTVDGGFPAMCNVEVQPLNVAIPDSTQTISANGKGTITLTLTIPSAATVTGSFLIQFPAGLTLDEQLTVLSAQLSGNFTLVFTTEANNTWLITIKSNGLKSSAATPSYQKIMDIAYKVYGGIQKGTYKATIQNLDFKLNDGTEIKKDLIPVTINVSQSFTSIDKINDSSFYATIINNLLRIESPQTETIKIYSTHGVLLYSAIKNAGRIEIPVSSLKGSVYIIKGSVSGAIKVIK